MRITKVTVTKLFGLFDHEIRLHLDERITIVHGANGLGKTVILRMLTGLFQKQMTVFRKVPFECFRVDFDSGQALEVRVDATQPDPSTPTQKLPRLELTAFEGSEKLPPYTDRFPEALLPGGFDHVERWLPYLTRLGPQEWMNDRTGEVLTLEDIFERFSDSLPIAEPGQEPAHIARLRGAVNVKLVKTQRLDLQQMPSPRHRKPSAIVAVEKNSEAITFQIKSTLGTYAAVSQKLDRDFPLRLFGQQDNPVLSAEELRRKLTALEERREKLKTLGFLDLDHQLASVPDAVLDQKRDIFSIYVADVEQKLAVFDDLARRIELFTEIINARFLYKKLEINREKGYVFISDSGATLKPADLSSGEQHELVLFHELTFGMAANSLLLVDEPEISLHIVWQQNFLPDLRRVVGISTFDAIIATHSPEIIGDNWGLTVELKGPAREVSA